MLVRILLGVGIAVLCGACAWGKTGRNYYTEERLEWMRDNLARHEWAQAERDRIIARADRWGNYDDETLQRLVPPPQVARCIHVHADGCPVHGAEILRHPGGIKSWRMSFDEPYRIQCPVGGEWYPSNDFWAYLQGGCDDESLLTGDFVDDGWGWQSPDHDKKYWFVGFYAGEMTRRWLLPAIRDMSAAYLLTDDPRYAHKTALLLWKLAEHYPEYEYENQSRYGLEFQRTYYGRLQYYTWECFTIEAVAPAYDAVWPAIEGNAALERFTGRSAAQIRGDIEERMLRVMAADIMAEPRRIGGNYGMHQAALLQLALVLDTQEGEHTSADMVDWVVTGPERVTLYTATPLPDALINLFHRDGVPFESPSYNCGWMSDLEEVAELLLLNGVDVWAEPRFQGLYLWPLKTLVCGTMTQPEGDSNNLFAGALGIQPRYLERAFQRLGDPRLARAMVQSGAPFRRDLFHKSLEADIRAAAEQHPETVGVTGELLPGYGYATLQTGTERNRTALAVRYGHYTAHRHFDTLNLELYSRDHPLTPDLGYPETADTFDPRRFGWLSHNIVHNTVMVNATRQTLAFGEPVSYHPEGWAQFTEARSPLTYPEVTSDYRRAAMLVDLDGEDAYAFDVFRVVGGQQHDWVIHGNEAEFSVEGIALSEPRTEGTLAGPDVPYGRFYDDPALIEGKSGTRYHGYTGSAFQWLFNVQEAPLDGVGAAVWRLNRDPALFPRKPTEGVGLRAHFLAQDETIFAADGIPQRRQGWPESLKWVIRRRAADDLASTFATILEPFGNNAPPLARVERLPVTPEDGSVAARVTFAVPGDGAVADVVFWTPEPAVEHRFGGFAVAGRAAIIRLDADGQALAARLFDGTRLHAPGLDLHHDAPPAAVIEQVDYEVNTVTLDRDALEQNLAGNWAVVDTGMHVTAVRIESVLGPRAFSLGNQDLRTGTGGVLSVDDNGTVHHDRVTYFTTGGMTVLDETGVPVGRLELARPSNFILQDLAPTLDNFPDADGDGRRRFTVMAFGAGDRITIPTLADVRRDMP